MDILMKENLDKIFVDDGSCKEEKTRENHETRREDLSPHFTIFSLDEFLCFEITSEIEHLPCCETKKTAHTKYTEEQYSVVG